MWTDFVKHLGTFSSAVLTGLDKHGYPYSIRCQPVIDHARKVLVIHPSEGIEILPGLGCLLCHSHDERIWNLKSFIARGLIEREEDLLLFRPHQFIPGMGIHGLKGYLRFVADGRRNAKRYLEARGLKRPKVAWNEMEELMVLAKTGPGQDDQPPGYAEEMHGDPELDVS
jgi:hypothetical protein